MNGEKLESKEKEQCGTHCLEINSGKWIFKMPMFK